jgi:hypothetical protein
MFYQPVRTERYFHSCARYSEIDWQDFRAVVEAFRLMIREWYLAPADELRKTWDHAFSLMAINCLLIDALSQYYYGKRESSQTFFKRFARTRLPAFRAKLPEPIRQPQPRRKKGAKKSRRAKDLETYADVLYVAFRCGILHEAHVLLCGGLAGLGGKLCDVDPDICTMYRDGSDCPSVRMDPAVIYDDLKKVIDRYLADLVDPAPAKEVRRRYFKHKFKASFGIDLATSKL